MKALFGSSAALVFLVSLSACRSSTPGVEVRPTSEPSLAPGARVYTRPTEAELAKLSPFQRRVTQNADTEPPFQNAYWDHHAKGLYVDVVTGEPLFSSRDKFESGTGWPSFTRPVEAGRVLSSADTSHGMERVEVVSAGGRSHLGHVFDDGPPPTGQRFCINSASLRFVPFADLEREGYGAYKKAFLGADGAPPPAATQNACAFPKPGEKAGCSATLAVALFAGPCVAAARDGFDRRPEVIDTSLGVEAEGGPAVVKVIYDPTKAPYRAVVEAFLSGAGREGATVLAADEGEANVARGLLRAGGAQASVRISRAFRVPGPGEGGTTMGRAATCSAR